MEKIESFFKDKKGKWAVVAWPNILLWGWIACTVILMFVKTGKPHDGFTFLGGAILFAWSYLEITSGWSPFRRVLGVLVMASTVLSRFR